MASHQKSVLNFYQVVIDDVISNVRDAFMEEGVDECVLQELKQMWTNKLMASGAVNTTPVAAELPLTPIIANELNTYVQNPNAVATSTTSAEVSGNNENSSTSSGIQPTDDKPSEQPSQQQTQPSVKAEIAALDPNKIITVNITLPAQPGSVNSEGRILTIHVPASSLQGNQLKQILTPRIISVITSLPTSVASSILQQHADNVLQKAENQKSLNNSNQLDGTEDITAGENFLQKLANISIQLGGPSDKKRSLKKSINISVQLDGAADTSDEEMSEECNEIKENNFDDDLDMDDDGEAEGGAEEEEEPINSGDEITDENAIESFDTENIIVCQYDKVARKADKWRFNLKDGVMNIGGKDYVFKKLNGTAEW